ncbi:MAG: hypothetical protein Q3999_03295 [Buchananella hordeovulneris]|nr:hypothetical protein [Buchananella hordeovulneris]
MNNRNHTLDALLAKERAAYQKRVRRLREQARKDEERLMLRTARLIQDKHRDTYQRFEEEARRLLAEERATRSSRAKATSASEQADAQMEQPGVMQHE